METKYYILQGGVVISYPDNNTVEIDINEKTGILKLSHALVWIPGKLAQHANNVKIHPTSIVATYYSTEMP